MLSLFQMITAVDNGRRKANGERLRELATSEGNNVRLICSHDPHELDREQARGEGAATAR